VELIDLVEVETGTVSLYGRRFLLRSSIARRSSSASLTI
jgi:hypothetical protein